MPANTDAALWDADNQPLHWNEDLTPKVVGMTLNQCLTEINAGIKEFQSAFDKTVSAAIRIGHAALSAKELAPEGKWTEWLAANVTTMSGTWVRVCMRAAEVSDRLATRADRDAIIAHAGTVEGVAALLPWLKENKDPKALPPPKDELPKRARSPNKLKRDGTPNDATEDAPKDEDRKAWEAHVQKREADLDRREKVLDAKEDRLIKMEEALNERERNLSMREARHPVAVADATIKPMALKPETSLDDTRAMLAKAEAKRAAKAAAKATAAARSVAKPKGNGKVAPTPKIAPETVAAIQAAAQRAVGTGGTSPEVM